MRRAVSFLLSLLCLAATACNDPPLRPGPTVAPNPVSRLTLSEFPVDVIFVVAGRPSMCETHLQLIDAVDQMVDVFVTEEIDFQFAVVNTDMRDMEGGIGMFRTEPGTYDESLECQALAARFEPNECDSREGGVVARAHYSDREGLARDRLVRDLSCRLAVGTETSSVEMGLSSLRSALENPAQLSELKRLNSVLAVVVVSDQNDCSDGTYGDAVGPVYEAVMAGLEGACEDNRNIEDSCTYANRDRYNDPDGDGVFEHERNLGPTLTYFDLERSARSWCSQSTRTQVETLQSALDVDCPAGRECANGLLPRAELFDFLSNMIAESNGYPMDAAGFSQSLHDVFIATAINPDHGERSPSGSAPVACGTNGKQGYRYQALAESLPPQNRLIIPTCNRNGELDPESPPDSRLELGLGLQEFAQRLANRVHTSCLPSPLKCETDVDCDESRCSAVHFEGKPWEYRTCESFEIKLGQSNADGSWRALTEGVDFIIEMESNFCVASGFDGLALRLMVIPPSAAELEIDYPRARGDEL